ncbi:MAG: DUF1638 domain-containing protein [Actinomycetota bacterium]|nr:DUF1638 domain-containing protein [Actinomycetota bacterium]
MKNIAIVCDVMKDEFTRYKNEAGSNLECIFLEQHLHNTPDIMNKKLQETINSINGNYEKILLGYGLCSNGVVNLKSEKYEIIIPKVDDCISLFLGSKEKYLEEFSKDPATYYLCRGWIEYGGDPYRGYLLWTGQEDKIPESWLAGRKVYGRKYDMEMADFLFAEMMKNYNQVTLIDNDDLEEIHRKYARDMVDFMSKMLNKEVKLKIIRGSSKFISKLAHCKYDEINFLKINPGEIILQEHFMKQD